LVNKARSTYFDVPSLAWGTVTDETISGLIKLAARENAPNPRYLAAISDIGELILCDKDGSKIYGPVGPFTGHGSPDELSINTNREVLIRSGTNLALINADGTVRWNKQGASAIANLVSAKIGDSYLCTFIGTGAAATSGVQWRSLTDGSIVQDLYGIAQSPAAKGYYWGPIAVSQTGDRAAIVYNRGSDGTVGQPYLEHHHRTSGRLWSVTPGNLSGTESPMAMKVAVDKDGGYTIMAAKTAVEGTANGNNYCKVYDSTGALLGTPWSNLTNQTYLGVCMAPDGRQAGAYADSGTNYYLYRVVVVPYSSSTTTLAARGHGLDITDDDLYYTVGCEDGKLYIYRVDGYAMGNTTYGGASTPIATVRNYT
jgi:hypothetical protein